ncbi:acetylxylan esterase [Demequina sp. NBRC 110056]|uniref:acetylxylan esterase n=1 Tax=Demequina sp. NBRC 110056 TaxID=1570345 RepID=UPI000A018181|nr:acetylxylan esterase [Demequina sp. NBRC 110056]
MAKFDLPEPELRAYRPEVSEPADFDAFWERTLEEARQTPMRVDRAAGPIDLAQVVIEDVTFPGFGGDPIKGWLLTPRGAEGPLPCVVEISGYGGGRGLAIERTLWATAGYAHLFIDSRGQGLSWGSGAHTPDPVGSGPAVPGQMTRGIHDPHEYYYRRLFTDAVRGVDAARSLPEVDPSQVFFVGTSQGGGVALAVAGLVPDLAGCAAEVPFLCHFDRAIDLTDAYPYQELVTFLKITRKPREEMLATLQYFDGVNHAKRAHAPLLMSAALMDEVCPPSTCFAAFNWYGDRSGQSDKAVEVYGYNGHEGGQAHQQMRQLEFVARLVG